MISSETDALVRYLTVKIHAHGMLTTPTASGLQGEWGGGGGGGGGEWGRGGRRVVN